MTNPMLLMSGIGMITVGLIPTVYWHKTKRIGATPFILGAVTWVAAIAPKAAIELALGGQINTIV